MEEVKDPTLVSPKYRETRGGPLVQSTLGRPFLEQLLNRDKKCASW
jgi:hypothetical protein